jgi:hypothetical protein
MPKGENQFRDMYKRKIIGLIGPIKNYDYVFEPNHSYDINRIANEVRYLMNQTTVKPKKWIVIRHVLTKSIKREKNRMKRLELLLSCIHHMNEDAIYEPSPFSSSTIIPETKQSYSIYASFLVYTIVILLILCLPTNKPYFLYGILILILLSLL